MDEERWCPHCGRVTAARVFTFGCAVDRDEPAAWECRACGWRVVMTPGERVRVSESMSIAGRNA